MRSPHKRRITQQHHSPLCDARCGAIKDRLKEGLLDSIYGIGYLRREQAARQRAHFIEPFMPDQMRRYCHAMTFATGVSAQISQLLICYGVIPHKARAAVAWP